MDKARGLVPMGLPACPVDRGGIGFPVARQRVTGDREDHRRRQVGKIGIVQRGVAWIVHRRCPTGSHLLVKLHIRNRQLRCVGVGDIAAPAAISAQSGIDQNLTRYAPVMRSSRGMGDGGSKIAARTVPRQYNPAVICGCNRLKRGPCVVEASGKDGFGGERVVDRDHTVAGRGANFGADIIVTVEPANNKPAAVIVDDRDRGCVGLVNATWDAAEGHVPCADPIRVGLVKSSAHPVIDSALLVDGE